jgi:CheY-like chemotaxis protein
LPIETEARVTDVKPIFYIEDTSDDANLLLRAAEHQQFPNPIIILSSAELARSQIERAISMGKLPCTIMVDLSLPKESGVSLIRWMRSLDALRLIPIIAISGKYAFESIDQVYKAGANLFLIKPSKSDEWGGIIDRLKRFCS